MSDVMRYELENGVALITIDSPPVNALGWEVRKGVVEGIERAAGDNGADAIVVICDGRTFFAGADITEFGKPPKAPSLRDVCETVENSAKPVIAAIHGTALGGGFELALNCHYRIAVPSAKVGLPEVNLGILPGAGGTQRLPRLVGAERALDLITSGKSIGAEEARQLEIIDALADEGALRKDSIAAARRIIDQKVRLVRVRDRNDKLEAARDKPEVFDAFRKKNARRFRGFKAPEAIIKAIEAAVERSYEDGMARERELFMELVTSHESAAQRYAFFAERRTSKIPDIPRETPAREIKQAGVIGAGTMGGGITMNFLNAGVPVALVEQNGDALERGLRVIRKNYERSAKKDRMTVEDVERRMALIRPTTDMEALREADLIIEAVFELMSLKLELFAKLDAIAKSGAILASNTSYLDLNKIAAATARPEDVCGLHFFSPANVMPLLEIVRAEKTGKDVIQTAMRLAKKIKKTPVLAGVCHGFVANRAMRVRGLEADRIILQGVSPEDVDRVIYEYGFAMGPFQMRDLVGLDVIGRDSNEKTVISELVARGRLGQKQNGGFYDYDENRRATPSPVALEVIRQIAEEKGVKQEAADDDEIRARLLYPVVNEGAKILDEGIALRASDIDIALIKGYNWPVYRGGPMFWADAVGLPTIVDALKAFEERFGAGFAPAPLLERYARQGKRLTG